jgi:RHH-type proline utilization regulon transcriptional repressor/proline dehydrogenase/delta 1-pyrroline-5-carboxylate dehydrogenase
MKSKITTLVNIPMAFPLLWAGSAPHECTGETAMTGLSRSTIAQDLFADETALVRSLADAAALPISEAREVRDLATKLVEGVRKERASQGSIDSFMQEYSLSSEEGVVLMCLAESLLRIPDAETADRLIADKLGEKDWASHLGQSSSLLVNASAWGLMLTGKILDLGKGRGKDAAALVGRLVARSGEPVIRAALKQAMRIMGRQFVLGRTISEALAVAKPLSQDGWRFSFDMLGESAMTAEDAERYHAAYLAAAQAIGNTVGKADIFAAPSISVKLSALHPR